MQPPVPQYQCVLLILPFPRDRLVGFTLKRSILKNPVYVYMIKTNSEHFPDQRIFVEARWLHTSQGLGTLPASSVQDGQRLEQRGNEGAKAREL